MTTALQNRNHSHYFVDGIMVWYDVYNHPRHGGINKKRDHCSNAHYPILLTVGPLWLCQAISCNQSLNLLLWRWEVGGIPWCLVSISPQNVP